MAIFESDYLAADIIFEEDAYYWINPKDNKKEPVMMTWETPIMQKMADVAVEEGDHVIEMGFGMGILANMIQAKKPASHTIVECHKDILPKLNEWAKDKENVIVVSGKWIDTLSDDTKYDSIIFDTYADGDAINFSDFAVRKAKFNKTKVTWWNPDNNDYGFDNYNLTYTEINVSPPDTQDYYDKNTFKIPLKILE